MKVITRSKLQEIGGLYIENIIDGTNQYPYRSKKCSEEAAIAWILQLAKKHDMYADFYAGRIGEESLVVLKEHLSIEEWGELQQLLSKCKEYEKEFIIFRPEQSELSLLVKLSYRELLFSTFYLTTPAVTVWSNYDGEFIVLAENEIALSILN